MRKSTLVMSLIRCGLLLASLSMGAAVCLAQAQRSDVQAEVADLLKKHDDALNQHNLEGVLALYSASPKTVVMGTGAGERFQGKEEIKAAYTEIFKDFDKGTMAHNCYWKTGGGNATLVWGAATCKFSDSKGEKKREYEMNVSLAAEKQGGKWQFVMLHYSNPTGGTTASQ